MKTYLIAAAFMCAAGFLLQISSAVAAGPCDCQKELQRLSDARTDAERLEDAIAKMDGKIADALGDADHMKRNAETLKRQFDGTRDLVRRARAKGANVDTQDIRDALKDAEKELRDAERDAARTAEKAAGLERDRDALKAKLKQAQAAAKAAENAYRACRHKCTGMKDNKAKPQEVFVAPGFGDPDNVFSGCLICDKTYEDLQESKEEYEEAEKAYNAARDRLDAAEKSLTNEVNELEAAKQGAHDAGERAMELDRQVKRLGGKDPWGSPDFKETMAEWDRFASEQSKAAGRVEAAQRETDEARAALEKANSRLRRARADMSRTAKEVDKCNNGCPHQPNNEHSSLPGWAPHVSFGVGMGVGGGHGGRDRFDDRPRSAPRD